MHVWSLFHFFLLLLLVNHNLPRSSSSVFELTKTGESQRRTFVSLSSNLVEAQFGISIRTKVICVRKKEKVLRRGPRAGRGRKHFCSAVSRGKIERYAQRQREREHVRQPWRMRSFGRVGMLEGDFQSWLDFVFQKVATPASLPPSVFSKVLLYLSLF